MTEACSSLTFMTLYDPTKESCVQNSCANSSNLAHKPDGICVGKPAPHIEIWIAGDDSSCIGRILTRGPHVMLGYWGQMPSKNSSPTDECWLDTGDIGHIDDCGNVWLIGRLKGRIKSGGENVYPEEVSIQTLIPLFLRFHWAIITKRTAYLKSYYLMTNDRYILINFW